MFKPIYQNYTCPVDEAVVVRLLVNPTGAIKTDWATGRIGGCEDCARSEGGEVTTFCATCTAARARMGRAWHAVYGETRADGLDLSAPEKVIPTLTEGDVPDEVVAWLLQLPPTVWAERLRVIEGKLPGSSPTGSSSTSSPTMTP